jgi:hypothetical protein
MYTSKIILVNYLSCVASLTWRNIRQSSLCLNPRNCNTRILLRHVDISNLLIFQRQAINVGITAYIVQIISSTIITTITSTNHVSRKLLTYKEPKAVPIRKFQPTTGLSLYQTLVIFKYTSSNIPYKSYYICNSKRIRIKLNIWTDVLVLGFLEARHHGTVK